MITLRDNTKAAKIAMFEDDAPDWAADFYDVGALEINDNDEYIAKNVDYCIDQAHDWEQCRGDFADDDNTRDRSVIVEIVE